MFDDGVITLGQGAISVDGEMVSGSRTYRRDPRLHHPTTRMVEAQFRRAISEAVYAPLPSGMKWCCCACHRESVVEAWNAGILDKTLDVEQAERGNMPIAYFGEDRRNFDRHKSWCKLCIARRERMAYAIKVGRPVRSYQRR